MIEVEVLGLPEGGPSARELARLCELALAQAGIDDGHLAVEFVSERRIRELNRDHRGVDRPTDVLSFAIDGAGPSFGPRELGDIVICPARARDIREAVVHGALHLAGMDHERDEGKMLTVQAELLRRVPPA